MTHELRPSDIGAIVVAGVFGAITGWMLADAIGAIVGASLGIGFGVMAGRADVRPAITMTVFVGGATGALIGASVVETICLPGSCTPIAMTSAIVVGLAAMVGVGLVAALVTRSFDEYHEHVDAGSEPPGPGCERDTDESDG